MLLAQGYLIQGFQRDEVPWPPAGLTPCGAEYLYKKYGSRAVAFVLGGSQGWVHLWGGVRFANLFQGTVPEGCSWASDHGICMGYQLCFYPKPPHDLALPCVRETHDMIDLVNSKLIIIWGSNVAETYTPEMHFILDAKEKGAKLIVVDPRLSDTAKSADWWVPVRPGTDAALALGMMNVIFAHDLHDKDFISRYTIGPMLVRSDNGLLLRECDVVQGGSKNEFLVWDSEREKAIRVAEQGAKATLLGICKPYGIECKPAFQLLYELAEQYPPEKVSKIIEIPAEDIKRLALEYARCKLE